MVEYYDIVLSSPFPNYHFFAHKMRELYGQQNLSFFLVNDIWVDEFQRKLRSQEIGVRVLLDLTANQTIENDPYLLLAREVKRQGGYVIDDPDVTANSAHKGRFHQMLVYNGIPVPETVIVNRDELDSFKITKEIKDKIGVPFVVKPAWGDSGVGVVVDAESEDALHWSAEQTPNSDAFLIQKQLQPQNMGSHLSWFRMFHICREVIPCWWNPATHDYQLVSPDRDTYPQACPFAAHHARHSSGLQDEKIHFRDLPAPGRQFLRRGLCKCRPRHEPPVLLPQRRAR